MMEDKEGRFYCQEDLLDGIWNDRPELSKELAYLVDIKYVGTSREEKIEMVRRAMKNMKLTCTSYPVWTISHGC